MVWLYVMFVAFVLAMLAMDLGVFHRHAHVVSIKESLVWVGVWVSMALLFSVFIYFAYYNQWFGLSLVELDNNVLRGPKAASRAMVLFLTGYMVEESLSADNMFVIAMIMTFFAVPRHLQHRLLYWGILGALVMRGAMIGAGSALVHAFDWVLYVFGAFLVFTAIKMFFVKEETEVKQSILVKYTRKLMPVTDDYQGQKFMVRHAGKIALTPLALALISIESADVIFAVDSIPAIFGITKDTFLVFTSNIFAILGLRSMYFALAGVMAKFQYLKYSLSVLLAVIGLKMLLKDPLHHLLGDNLNYCTLGITVLILASGVVVSLIADKRQAKNI